MHPPAHAERHAQQVSVVATRGNPHAAGTPASHPDPDAPDLPPAILQSWQRCLAQPGLDPFRPRAPEVLDAGRLRERGEPLASLLRLAESELGLLLESFSGSGYAVILTDADGVILRHRCDPTLARELRTAGLRPGADWGEARVGTNGIGTCIVEGRPVTVHREDHFLRQNIGLTCSAAPIRDPQGRLLGILDLSCCAPDHSRAGQALARALVSRSANILENQHFLGQFRDQRVLRCHPRPEGIGLPQESLIESELFGYRAGAFTGASREGRRGRIAEASGGTLFLDEIADMPPAMQSRLLRVLETQEVVPLGAGQALRVELNIIAASHQDLAQLVVEGRFREDLFYRLNGITLHLTPLRLRGDLEAIVLKVLEAENDTGQALDVTPAAMAALLAFAWPGNIRQLRNVIRTAVALCEEGRIQVEHLNLPRLHRTAAPLTTPQVGTGSAAGALKAAELEVVRECLGRHQWNISRTAATLGMSRNTLYRKIHRYGLAPG